MGMRQRMQQETQGMHFKPGYFNLQTAVVWTKDSSGNLVKIYNHVVADDQESKKDSAYSCETIKFALSNSFRQFGFKSKVAIISDG